MIVKQQTSKSGLGEKLLMLIIILSVTVGSLYLRLTHPNYVAPTGFGPEWQCTPGGAKGGGPLFCVKKELLAPATQTPPKS